MSQNGYAPNGHIDVDADDGFQHDPSYTYDVNANSSGNGVKTEIDYEGKPDIGDEYDEEMFKQDDWWLVINTFFEDKGLVRQQLESFNEFIEVTMQEIVEDNRRLILDQHQQYTESEHDATVSHVCDPRN